MWQPTRFMPLWFKFIPTIMWGVGSEHYCSTCSSFAGLASGFDQRQLTWCDLSDLVNFFWISTVVEVSGHDTTLMPFWCINSRYQVVRLLTSYSCRVCNCKAVVRIRFKVSHQLCSSRYQRCKLLTSSENLKKIRHQTFCLLPPTHQRFW